MEYKLSKIAEITNGTLYGEDLLVRNIATDSRNQVSSESLFVALRGRTHDGHQYIAAMAKRGVNSFLVEQMPDDQHLVDQLSLQHNCSFVVVHDTLMALQAWATYHRQQYCGPVIAITGSNGKTVVKEWFVQLWDNTNGTLLRSPRSYNSQLGVALSLLMIDGSERLVMIEAGISMVGEMDRLEAMIRPTIGVLTNVGDSHLQNFESSAELRYEKMRLFRNVETMIESDDTITQIDDRNRELVLRIYEILGLRHRSVTKLQPIAMRLELKEGIHNSTIINDSYVNDLASLTIALDYQNRFANPRKVLIISDFGSSNTSANYGEQNPFVDTNKSTHEPYTTAAALVTCHGIELTVGIGSEIGQNRAKFAPNSLFFNTTEDFLKNFDARLITNSSVLLKGSRSFGFEIISSMLEKQSHTTVLEIDLDAMATNLNHYRNMLSTGCRTMVMVKAQSYGSGSVEVASMLQHQGVDYLAVAFADEGVTLRNGGIHLPIVVLNSDPHSFQTMISHCLEPEIYSLLSLQSFIATAERSGVTKYPIHIKLDTGMNRLGFMPEDVDEMIEILGSQNSLRVASIFSHLAAADDPQHDEFTAWQIDLFEILARQISANDNPLLHVCNTAGIERFPAAHLDMVRLGIGLYTGTEIVSRLRTKIVQIKHIATGESIGYGRLGRLDTPGRVATIPIGYADGLNRHLSCGVGKVLIGGVLCPIVGNICMDTCMVDIRNVPSAAEGDTVVIFGDNPTVGDMAKWLGTISYEILTGVSSRIKRIYING